MIRNFFSLFDAKFLKFIVVGIVNTAVGTAVMFALYNIAGLDYWISSASNYIVGSIISYILNRKITFQNKDKVSKTLAKFVINIVICYGISYGLAKPIVLMLLSSSSQKAQDNISMLVGMGLFTLLNYLGQRLFAFAGKSDK